MGFIGKIVGLILIILVLWFAAVSIEVDNESVCVKENQRKTEFTCIKNNDCIHFMTAMDNGYPSTPMYKTLLEHSTSCNERQCYIKDFELRKDKQNQKCAEGESEMMYKVTPADWIILRIPNWG